jgi:dTDP-4-dehydrorhamnose 3,5-epimerase
MQVKISDFVDDQPWDASAKADPDNIEVSIEGVTVAPFKTMSDGRGSLTELLTQRTKLAEPIVHVYQVHCAPQSVRGWVFHRHQEDRLACTEGKFVLALYDIREDSKTKGALMVLKVGADNPCRVTIPRFVAHVLKNDGDVSSSFVNLPTNVYDPARPDKARLAYPDSRIPFTF